MDGIKNERRTTNELQNTSSARRPANLIRAPKLHPVFAALAALLLVSAAGNAAAVTLAAAAPQTEDGQDFDFRFDSVLLSDGTDGELTIQARGDYQPGNPTEFLTWDLDFLGIGTTAAPLMGNARILQENSVNDVEWIQSFTIQGSDLLDATADGTLSILIDLYLDEDTLLGVNHYADTEYVAVALRYAPAIPEPSSVALFVVGSVVVGLRLTPSRRARRP